MYKRNVGASNDAKCSINVFPGQKAHITDCRVGKQITLTFTHEHARMHSLYKRLLITRRAPGAGNPAVSESDMAPTFPARVSPRARVHAVSPGRA